MDSQGSQEEIARNSVIHKMDNITWWKRLQLIEHRPYLLTCLKVLGANYLNLVTKSNKPLAGTYAKSVLLKKLHSYLLFEPVLASIGSVSIYKHNKKIVRRWLSQLKIVWTYRSRPYLVAFDLYPNYLVGNESLIWGLGWRHFWPPPRRG